MKSVTSAFNKKNETNLMSITDYTVNENQIKVVIKVLQVLQSQKHGFHVTIKITMLYTVFA